MNKKKNKLINILMVVAIILIIGSAIMIVANYRGWFNNKTQASKSSKEKYVKEDNIENEIISSSDENNNKKDRDFSKESTDSDNTIKSKSTKEVLSKASADKKSKNNNNQKENKCSIQIVCSSILNNTSQLNKNKAPYVPKNGVILATTMVEFEKGQTAFDVIKKVCSAYGIQLEYSYTPAYGSYYIEGIGNIYEFDCGSQSGWMYKVNGVFPNYGCSSYELNNGDNITFCYTCSGLGSDV